MALTYSGTISAQSTLTLQDAALHVQGMHDAARKVNPDSGAVDTCFSTTSYIRRTA
jgi:predicted TIM-barrel enzyme